MKKTYNEYHYVVIATSEKESVDLMLKGVFARTEKHNLRKEWRE